ncbi:MAG TPA: patatin-like protein [Pyrinomonadaceae bacterium]|jgi:patatin-related protein
MSDTTKQTIEVVKEIRFAVVMYGGVSLAIYINGVAQELLKMVRATSVVKDDSGNHKFRIEESDLSDTELVYRALSYLIADDSSLNQERPSDYLKPLADLRVNLKKPAEQRAVLQSIREAFGSPGDKPKVVRFVVDILSGSSAGGINGVYLAKALANGQSIEKLEKLWIEEGNFTKLLRDDMSVYDDATENGKPLRKPLGLKTPPEARSLLNSERMYLKLLDAFYQMDDGETPGKSFVNEIDLFVTMTDFYGIPVPIHLFDRIIHERRHRQVLHFRYRLNEIDYWQQTNKKEVDLVNHFQPELYPFLAYAARCTSSFPLAFDPMQLARANCTIKRMRKLNPLPGLEPMEKGELWQKFFQSIQVQNNEIDWSNRVFVDGGYLDNKPFGYAIGALAAKQSDVLIERKLIYVEPEPDMDDYLERAVNTKPPSAIENTLAALTEMPRYETIREDLEQVLQRNRLIVRIDHLVNSARLDEFSSIRFLNCNPGGMQAIVNQHGNLLTNLSPRKINEAGKPIWNKLTIAELAQQKGKSAYSYYRLRVSAVSDDLARMVARRAGFDADSIYLQAIRDLTRFWRRKNFDPAELQTRLAGDEKTLPGFLYDYDFNYRLRRLRFVLHQADRLLKFDEKVEEELASAKSVAEDLSEVVLLKAPNAQLAFQERFQLIEPQVFEKKQLPSSLILRARSEEKELLEQTIRSFKTDLNRVLQKLRWRLWEINPDSVVSDDEKYQLRRDLDNKVRYLAQDIGIDGLKELIGEDNGGSIQTRLESEYDIEARDKKVAGFIEARKQKGVDIISRLDEIGNTLRQIYNESRAESIFAVASSDARNVFQTQGGDSLKTAVCAYLQHFYDNFDAYDEIVFPVTYETPIGEGALVEVARISPLDATDLIDELLEMKIPDRLAGKNAGCDEFTLKRIDQEIKDRNLSPGYRARRKLAGGSFRAFGAFFHQDWRRNDILWGRLDAAERLVSIVLPDDNLKREITAEIHETILTNSSFFQEKLQLNQTNLTGTTPNPQPENNFDRQMSGHIRKGGLEIYRELPRKGILKTVSRSVKILSKMVKADGKMLGQFDCAATALFAIARSLFVLTILNVLITLALLLIIGFAALTIGLNGLSLSNLLVMSSWIFLALIALALICTWFYLSRKIKNLVVGRVRGK